MSRLRRFVSPGWILGLLAVAVFTWACFAILAPWQLGKNTDLDQRNDQLAQSVQADPAPLREVVTSEGDWSTHEWRLVTLRGEFSGDQDAMLRLRSVSGDPVFHVLGVFRADDGTNYLVNRGTIPVGEGNTVGDYEASPGGEQEITARVRRAESGDDVPIEQDGYAMVRSFQPPVLEETFDAELEPGGYLQLVDGTPGVLEPAAVPGIEAGPYLSYGIQWIMFGVFAPLALGYFAWSEIKARRRDGTEDGVASGAAAGTDAIDGTGGPAEQATDRYGRHLDAERRRAERSRDRFSEL